MQNNACPAQRISPRNNLGDSGQGDIASFRAKARDWPVEWERWKRNELDEISPLEMVGGLLEKTKLLPKAMWGGTHKREQPCNYERRPDGRGNRKEWAE